MEQITIHNVETDEIIVREMTKSEAEQSALDAKAFQDSLAQKKAKEDSKAALLAKLGITEDEAKLLLS